MPRLLVLVSLLVLVGCRHAPAAAAPSGSAPEASAAPQAPDPPPPPPPPPVADPPPPPPPPPPAPPAPPVKADAKGTPGQQAEPCGEGGACAEGLRCVEYYGIAGPRGPKFTSCEIPCTKKTRCPAGQSCTVISDGPGSVCRGM